MIGVDLDMTDYILERGQAPKIDFLYPVIADAVLPKSVISFERSLLLLLDVWFYERLNEQLVIIFFLYAYSL